MGCVCVYEKEQTAGPLLSPPAACSHTRLGGRPFKNFLVQLAMGRVTAKHGLKLDRRFKVPKMRYKGRAVSQRIRAEQKPLISSVGHATASGPLACHTPCWQASLMCIQCIIILVVGMPA